MMISAKNLTFQYEHSNTGIFDVDFEIAPGEIILLSGDSGSGKSTLLKCLNALIPTIVEGRIGGVLTLYGKSYFQTPIHEINRRVASVFQNPRSQFFTTNTTSETVFAMENYGYSKERMQEVLDALIKEYSLEELMDRELFELSSGERQLIALASSTTLDQQIVLFDEPSANLDYGNAMFLSKQIRRLKQKGACVIVADHRFFYLKGLIDRVLFMEKGRLRLFDSEDEFVRSDYRTRSFDLFHPRFENRQSPPIGEKVASVRKLCFKEILKEVDLDLFDRQIVALVGVNGVGKTTLAKLLTKVIAKSSGTVQTKDVPFFIMQDADYQLFGTSVVHELKLLPDKPGDEEIMQVLKRLNLEHLKNAHPFDLSAGEKQRLQIALAILSKRSILIFDEPTSGLDAKMMKSVSDEILKLRSDACILVISHDYEFITMVADRVIFLEDKRVKEDFLLNDETVLRLNQIFKDMEDRYEKQ